MLTKTERNQNWLAKNPGYDQAWRDRHPEHSSWRAMIQRCTNPNAQNYSLYGGRGIGVCARWRESYDAFLQDVGPRPGAGYSIDRIDVDGNYEPGNCRWATRSEQQRNKRSGVPSEIRTRITREHDQGLSWRAIATGLNADEVPTPRGTRWYGVTAKDCFVRAAAEVAP